MKVMGCGLKYSGNQIGFSLVFVAFSLLFITGLGASPALAMDWASITRGGRLYDNWFLENRDRRPTKPHPKFTAFGPDMHASENSWRCASCHGWDYQGVAEYKTKPLDGQAGNNVASLTSILSDPNHQYEKLLSQSDIRDLAAFIAGGRIDVTRYIEAITGKSVTWSADEEALFASICANCHGVEGQKIRTMTPLGPFARYNPKESLHKILNGHPAEKMPPLRFVDTERLVRLLAYIQTLPAKSLVGSIARGGRLYDNWVQVNNTLKPTARHPAYPRNAGLADEPKANWRCKECHGWDYNGRAGAYGGGEHYTGIPGIRAFDGGDPQKVVDLLMDANHRYHGTDWFSGPLDFQDLEDLANFVTHGQIDMDQFIDPKTGLVKGDPKRRKDEFNALCATCHGREGDALATGKAIGAVARDNPWEALHKIRNGHPGEAMPALLALEMPFIVDILAYAQTLP